LENKYVKVVPVCFGHIGDGNIHLNIIKSVEQSPESFFNLLDEMKIDIYQLISKYRGTVSAEHGVGLLKKPYLHYSRSQAEINAMHAIKKIFDPNNIMNPGKLL
jgi:FAD/FMN-containing dehydrogenase